MKSVRISAPAEADLDAIWLYIATDSLVHADQFLEKFITTLTSILSTFPLVGRVRS